MYAIVYYDTTCHGYLYVRQGGDTMLFRDPDAADDYITHAGWERREFYNDPNAAVGCPRFGYHVARYNGGER